MSEIVDLSNEYEIIESVGKARAKTTPHNSFSETEAENIATHIDGFKAEYALAKYLKLRPDLSISDDGDEGYDLVLPDSGLTIEVKMRRGTGKDLALHSLNPRELKADVIVLCWEVEKHRIELVGWLSKAAFYRKMKILWFGRSRRLGVEPSVLADIEELRIIQERT